MVRRTDPLNARQVEVLRWIADGHPDTADGHSSFKRTAVALQDRRLVRISRRGGTWTATLTDEGRHYLQHGRHADDDGQQMPPRAVRRTARADENLPPAGPGSTIRDARKDARTRRQAEPARRSPTEKLVADVLAAGGTLDLQRSPGDGGERVSDLVRNANRHGKVPVGTRLACHRVRVDDGSYFGTTMDRIVLEDGPAGTDAPLIPVPVPERVGRYHPALAAFRSSGKPEVSAGQRARALRILHAVATEAERRGYGVAAPRPAERTGRHGTVAVWHLVVNIDGSAVPLRVSEENDRVPHEPTPRELADQARSSWVRIPTHDSVASGRLRIDIGAGTSSDRRSFWADRASWRLEDKLSELLREIAVRAEEIRARRLRRDEARAEHERALEKERRHAADRAGEARRIEVLEERLVRWRSGRELREYLADRTATVERAAATGVASGDLAAARAWLAWVTDRVEQLDPLDALPTYPEPQRLPEYELQKYMRHVPAPDGLHFVEPRF